jgi:hypothetical protein
MTCKDCVHFEACVSFWYSDYDWDCSSFEESKEKHANSKTCDYFKPTADVVEVVRCKDCKHLKIINDGKVYAKCTMTDFEFLPFGTDTREHYCGYGERSENG